MQILVLEDDTTRATYFIERFGGHTLKIIENAAEAIGLLTVNVFDLIFLDNDLGKDNGCGVDVAVFLNSESDNENNGATIIIHSWNTPAANTIQHLLPQAYFFPYNSNEFLLVAP